MKYKSKIDAWYVIAMLSLGAGAVWMMQLYLERQVVGQLVVAIFLAVMLVGFGIPMLLDTYYLLAEDHLRVRSWVRTNLIIPYADLLEVRGSVDQSAAPALSKDRLLVVYLKGGKETGVLISPVNKEAFRDELQSRIPVQPR